MSWRRLGITLFLFVLHGPPHMEPSIASMTGAAIILVETRTDISETLEHDIEWATIIFFITLFIFVAGAEQTGLIHFVADWLKYLSKRSLNRAVLMTLWGRFLSPAVIDNISLHSNYAPGCGLFDREDTRRGWGHPLVGFGSRRLPWRKWDYDRSQYQAG